MADVTAGNVCAVVTGLFCFLGGQVTGAAAAKLDNEGLLGVGSCFHPVAEIQEQLEGIGGKGHITEPHHVVLNGVDLGVVEGQVAIAENGCVWVPQTMKERAVLFISECLVIIVDRRDIVSNLHQAYDRISNDGYGCFISGPSKTADIAQALVMGAQAARGVSVVIR